MPPFSTVVAFFMATRKHTKHRKPIKQHTPTTKKAAPRKRHAAKHAAPKLDNDLREPDDNELDKQERENRETFNKMAKLHRGRRGTAAPAEAATARAPQEHTVNTFNFSECPSRNGHSGAGSSSAGV